MEILLVEDDETLVRNLTQFLKNEGYAVTAVKGQKDAIAKADEKRFDLVLLDVSLSDGNGYAVCTAIKATSEVPVIFLTASSDEFSVVTGLDMGAEDYISKPFRPRELASRIKSVLRRSTHAQTVCNIGNVRVDTVNAGVYKNNSEIVLSALEYKLLLVFINNRGHVLSRAKLLNEIWDAGGDYVNDNTLTVYIKRLREKIEEDAQNPIIIKTVRGLGYIIE